MSSQANFDQNFKELKNRLKLISDADPDQVK